MKRPVSITQRAPSPTQVTHVPDGARLVLADPGTVLLVVRGSCVVHGSASGSERIHAGSWLVPNAPSSAPRSRSVARAMARLQAAPDQRWTVERLARAVGVSRAALARHFRSELGRSPMRYLAELRLALAASQLQTSDDTLAEIAASVGYQSEFAFSRAFKRHHGVAPGTYRTRAPRAARPTLLAA